MLAGGFQDPVVGGHLLIGAALGTVLAVTSFLPLLINREFRLPDLVTMTIDARHVTWIFLNNLQTSIVVALILFFLSFLLRLLLRRQWLAGAVWILLTSGLGSLTFGHPALAAPFGVMSFGLMFLILIRFGLLPLAAGQFVMGLLVGVPMNANLSAWYAYTTIFALGVVLALAAHSFYTGLAGRALLRDGFLDN